MSDLLAAELGKLSNRLMIKGHTDSKPYGPEGAYSNWELSADRANAARRLMVGMGVGPNRVSQVRGFADQNLRKPQDPTDFSNRRVSVIVQFLAVPQRPVPGKPKRGTKTEGGSKPEGKFKGAP